MNELLSRNILAIEFNLECLGKLSQQGKIPLKKIFVSPVDFIKFNI